MRFVPDKINSLKLPLGKTDHIEWDDRQPGFGVRIRAGGKRTFIVQYKLRGKTRRDTIATIAGSSNKEKIAAARKEAEHRIEQASKRIDPRLAIATADMAAARTFGSVSAPQLRGGEAPPRTALEGASRSAYHLDSARRCRRLLGANSKA